MSDGFPHVKIQKKSSFGRAAASLWRHVSGGRASARAPGLGGGARVLAGCRRPASGLGLGSQARRPGHRASEVEQWSRKEGVTRTEFWCWGEESVKRKVLSGRRPSDGPTWSH